MMRQVQEQCVENILKWELLLLVVVAVVSI